MNILNYNFRSLIECSSKCVITIWCSAYRYEKVVRKNRNKLQLFNCKKNCKKKLETPNYCTNLTFYGIKCFVL